MSFIFDNGNVNSVSAGDRHTPRLDGDIYCFPACGCGCKKAEFDLAQEVALSIAKQLGGGWEPHVWENCGWHFEVRKGAATVSAERDGRYTASLEFQLSEGYVNTVKQTRADSRLAVEAVSSELNRQLDALKRALLSVSLDVIEIEFECVQTDAGLIV